MSNQVNNMNKPTEEVANIVRMIRRLVAAISCCGKLASTFSRRPSPRHKNQALESGRATVTVTSNAGDFTHYDE